MIIFSWFLAGVSLMSNAVFRPDGSDLGSIPRWLFWVFWRVFILTAIALGYFGHVAAAVVMLIIAICVLIWGGSAQAR